LVPRLIEGPIANTWTQAANVEKLGTSCKQTVESHKNILCVLTCACCLVRQSQKLYFLRFLTDGRYIYAEATERKPGETTVIYTAPITLRLNVSYCFELW